MIKLFTEKTPTYFNDILKITKFFDGTPKIEFKLNGEKELTLLWLYDDIGELFSVHSICKKIQKELPSCKIYLKIPYFPNARMDRTKNEEDTFTLKYMCEIVNSLKVESVEVFDPHSDVLPALLNNCKIKTPDDILLYLTCAGGLYTDILFFPDEGASKKYTRGKLGKIFKIAFGVKERDWKTRKILQYNILGEDIKDKRVLIIDDICSKGDTILLAAKKLKELGAKEINVFVSHCENIIEESELYKSNIIKNFYTTNSIFRKELNGITALDLLDMEYKLNI